MRRCVLVVMACIMFLPDVARSGYFTQDLDLGSYGPEVSFLEELLCQDRDVLPSCFATGGLYGPDLSDAVARFQRKVGISDPAVLGRVEATTRSYLNAAVNDETHGEFNAEVIDAQAALMSGRSLRDTGLEPALRSRSDQMRRLLKLNPRKARELRLAKKSRSRVPKHLRHLVETDVAVKGRLTRVYHDDFDLNYAAIRYQLETRRGERYEILGDDPRLATSDLATIRGIQLGGAVLPDPSSKAVKLRPPATALSRPRLRIAVIGLAFPDRPPPSVPVEDLTAAMSELSQYFHEVSYSAQIMEWQIAAWRMSRRSYEDYRCADTDPNRDPMREMQEEALALADPEIDYSQFDLFMLLLPADARCRLGGGVASQGPAEWNTADGTVEMTASMIVASRSPWLKIHEVGHNLTLDHASSLTCEGAHFLTDPLASGCTHWEYGDPFDPMGVGYGHFSAFSKRQVGYLSPSATAPQRVLTVTNPGDYAIEVLARPRQAGETGIKAIRLPHKGVSYTWVEYRQEIGFDEDPFYFDDESVFGNPPIMEGAFVRVELTPSERKPGGVVPPIHLLDGTPGRQQFEASHMYFPVGRTFYDPDSQYAVTPIAQTPDRLTVRVAQFPPLSCSPAVQLASVGSTVSFTANGGQAPYLWSSPGSPSQGSSNTFATSFNQPGTYMVSVGVPGTSLVDGCRVDVVSGPAMRITVNGSAGMATVPYGTYATVEWSAVNSTGCWARGSADQPTSGSYVVGPIYNPSIWGRFPIGYCYNGPHGGPSTIYSEIMYSNFATGSYRYLPLPTSGNDARCVEIISPAAVAPNERFSAEVTMLNSGSRPWVTDATPHRLGSRDVEEGHPPTETSRWSVTRVGLPGPVEPGEAATFRIEAVAGPTSTPGSYLPFDWQMVEEGSEWFGEGCRRRIVIQ